MKIFGKSLSEYINFQKALLVIVVVVGLLRLGLSLGGVPDSTARYVSLTLLGILCAIYYGIRVYSSGFGTYKHLLPLVFIQNVTTQAIIISGIVIAIFTNKDNIFSAPDFKGPFAEGKSFLHIVGHLTVGLIFPTLFLFIFALIAMFIARRVLKPSISSSFNSRA